VKKANLPITHPQEIWFAILHSKPIPAPLTTPLCINSANDLIKADRCGCDRTSGELMQILHVSPFTNNPLAPVLLGWRELSAQIS